MGYSTPAMLPSSARSLPPRLFRSPRCPPRPADTSAPNAVDPTRFVNPAQVGGIESYALADGPARGVRALCVNTGGGLRYRVLVDRGLDIDQAFFNQHSLAFLTHKGATKPSRGLDDGID